MRMDAGLDTGPIVAQSSAPRSTGDETAPELEAHLAAVAARCWRGRWPVAPRRARRRRRSPTEGVTLTRPLRREDGRLDPTRPAVGAGAPGPRLPAVAGDLPRDRRRAARRARGASVAPSDAGDEPGRLVRPSGTARPSRRRTGASCSTAGPPAGGRPMRGADWLRGRPASSADRARRRDAERPTSRRRCRPAPVSESPAMDARPPGHRDPRRAPGHRRRHARGAGGLVRRARPPRLSRPPGPRRRLERPRDRVRRDPDAAGRAARRARRRVPLRHRRRPRGPRGRRRADREGAPSPGRRAAHRIGAHALPGARRRRASGTRCASARQAGCAVGCPFCATGELGFERDLETAEIVDQVRHAARGWPPTGSG